MWRRCALLAAGLVAAGCAAVPPAVEPAASPPPRPAIAVEASCAARARRALAGPGADGLGLVLDSAVADAVDNDLGLPGAAADSAAPCVLRIGPPTALPSPAATLLGRARVVGHHQAGEAVRANREHARLRRELSAAERGRVGTVDLARTGEPLADLVGGLIELGVAGAEMLTREARVARLRAELAAIPAKLAEPRWRAYPYELLTVEAHRAAELPVALLDRRSGAAWRATSQVAESRRLRVAEGRRPDDLAAAPADQLDGLAAVEAWRQRGPPLRVSAALAHLLEVGTDAVAPAGASGSTPLGPALGADLRAGLLTLRGAAGTTLAVRIAAGLVVGDAQALGRSDVAQLVDGQGRRGLALVRSRSSDGLAILTTGLAGAALRLVQARPGPARLPVLAEGGGLMAHDGQLLGDRAGRLLWSGEGRVGVVVAGEGVVGLRVGDGSRVIPLAGQRGDGFSASHATPRRPARASRR